MGLYYWRAIASKLHNTPTIPLKSCPINTLGSIKRGGVLHSPTKTYKQNNTLLGVFSKHHGLNYFSLDYQRGITYGKEYSMHMHYPLVRYPINTLGSKIYFLKLSRVLHSHTRKPILSLKYSVIKHHGFYTIEGVLFMFKTT
jgi:hypothetical protein